MTFSFPQRGLNKEQILTQLEQFKNDDPDFKKGKTWSLVYYIGEEHHKLLQDAYGMYMNENGLNTMAFKSLKKMEYQVVRHTAELFHGNEDTVGCMTTGGTESLLMAIKTYRDRARQEKPWIRNPEIIVPESIHVAVMKACEYFNVNFKIAKLRKDKRVDLNSVKKLISRNTILIMGSAPQYPHGVIDPIEELSKLCLKKKIPLHVDACVGGFLLPFLEKNGIHLPLWDFRNEGVTSISADLHKYGYAAKGASLLLYKNMDFMKYQFFIYENWPGGVYASPSLPGTKSGGSIAAAWATIHSFGIEGYQEKAKIIWETSKKLQSGINQIQPLKLISNPDMSVFAFVSEDSNINIFAVADQMQLKGWHIDRQQDPNCIHMMVTPNHEKIADEYLKDLKEAVEFIRLHPENNFSGQAATYGLIAAIPFRSMVKKTVWKMMQQMYSASGEDIEIDKSKQSPKNFEEYVEKMGIEALKVKQKFDDVKKSLKSKMPF